MIATVGAVLSIEKVVEAELVFPAASVARARSVYEPSAGKLLNTYDQLVVPLAPMSTSVALAKLEPFQ